MAVVTTSFSITPAYDILLRGSESVPVGLYQLHMATAEQLCRLHYSMGSIKAVKAKLRSFATTALFSMMPYRLSSLNRLTTTCWTAGYPLLGTSRNRH